MLIETWYYQLLGTIPEAIAMVALGTALIKEKFTWKQITVAGLIVGLIGFLLQRTPIEYGVHIPLGIVTFMLVMSMVLNLNVLKSATAAILTFIILIVIEAVTFYLLVGVFGYSEELLTEGSDLVRFLTSLPPLCGLILLASAAQIVLRSRFKGGAAK